MSDETVNAEIIVKFKTIYLTDRESLEDDFAGNLDALVRWLVEEEGLFGICEDEFEILVVKECWHKKFWFVVMCVYLLLILLPTSH